MAFNRKSDPEVRRAYRQELRSVARLLRLAGMLFVLLGTVGIALSRSGAWFGPPSWVSFVLGWALILSGGVRRIRLRHNHGD